MNILRGSLCLLLIALNTLLACIPLYPMGAIRPLLPEPGRQRMSRWMDGIIDYWVSSNRLFFRLLHLAEPHVDGDLTALSRSGWHVVICNHQSWADILILQITLRDLVPPIKFFTKQQLIWIPLLGVAMWFLGFPYVRRLSREQIAANPDLAALDRETTLAACAGFRAHPTTVLNFLEGTRFTPAKHAAQAARFEHLLNPKLGGLSYVVQGLSDRLDHVIDITLDYPDGVPTFWDLIKGHCRRVHLTLRTIPLPVSALRAPDEASARAALTPWIESIWRDKDRFLADRLAARARATPTPGPKHAGNSD